MKIEVYLFGAAGSVEKKELEDINLAKLDSKQLLWINILERNEKMISKTASVLEMENVPLKSLLNVQERPKIDHFEKFYRFFIASVGMNSKGQPKRIPIDFLVGKNFVVTIHDGEVGYFEEFRQLEKGATQIGALNAESFVATLLNMHIVSYFRALEDLEQRVDELDDRILKTDMEDREFLAEMVALRACFAKLRRWFLPHRDVFYALSRPDFQTITDNESVRQFEQLNEHFENAVDMIESSRDTVLSLFDLYATATAQF